jgi:phosphoribosylformimino-5-aminoimidazole carboxamide ribotide isomerase
LDIFPAVDIKNGKCVRLTQGEKDREKVYADDPVKMAKHWEDEGAKNLHIVDLDGAFDGELRNTPVVKKIADSVCMFTEFGGGIRSLDDIEMLLSSGLNRIILGTKAYEDEEFIEEAVNGFRERVAVGLDARNGKISVKGWTENTDVDPVYLAIKMQKIGVQTIIYTDISTDGMLSGPNFEGIETLADQTNIKVIASGGITSSSDIRKLKKIEYKGVVGAIIGKALYEGTVRLREVL